MSGYVSALNKATLVEVLRLRHEVMAYLGNVNKAGELHHNVKGRKGRYNLAIIAPVRSPALATI